jgi:hypothetical protein
LSDLVLSQHMLVDFLTHGESERRERQQREDCERRAVRCKCSAAVRVSESGGEKRRRQIRR